MPNECWECSISLDHQDGILSSKHRDGWLCSPICVDKHNEPAVWRMQIAPDGKPAHTTAIREKVLGAGWSVNSEDSDEPMTWGRFEKLASRQYAGDNSWRSPLSKIENDMAIGDLVWIYDKATRNFYLGRIDTDWQYARAAELTEAGIFHFRGCTWYPIPLNLVPGAALTNRSIIRELVGVTEWSKYLWNFHSPTFPYTLAQLPPDELWSHVSHSECEDIVALYLQRSKGMNILPSTCKVSTPLVEFVMIEIASGLAAFAQVKSGNAHLNLHDFGHLPGKVFVFCASGKYLGSRPQNVSILEKRDIENFLVQSVDSLPTQLQRWVNPFKITNEPT